MGQAYDNQCELEDNDLLIASLKRRIRELRSMVYALKGDMTMTEVLELVRTKKEVK